MKSSKLVTRSGGLRMVLVNGEEAKIEKEKRYEKLKQQMRNSDCVKFSVNIPRQIHKKLKSAAAAEGKDMKEVLLELTEIYLQKFKAW